MSPGRAPMVWKVALCCVALALLTILVAWFFRSRTDDLVRAARYDDVATVRRLLERGAAINGQERRMWLETALIAATHPNVSNTFYYLLESGADVNTPGRSDGVTPLIA